MKILMIDDDQEVVATVRDAVHKIGPLFEIDHAASRDSAIVAIKTRAFDMVVCDLSIPTADDAPDRDVSHGEGVVNAIREAAPGTLCIVLTGVSPTDVYRRLVRLGHEGDVFGAGVSQPLLEVIEKKDLDDLIGRIKAVGQEIRCLEDVVIVAQAECGLDHAHRRILQVFARGLDGRKVEALRLSGGLSKSRTLWLRVSGPHDELRAIAVGKLGALSDIADEQTRGRKHVSPLLPQGCCVPDLTLVKTGAGSQGGLFYRYAEEFNQSAYNWVSTDVTRAGKLVSVLVALEKQWQSNAKTHSIPVREVRRGLVSDEEFGVVASSFASLHLEDFESRQVTVRLCIQHGDLHGENILVRQDGAVLVIDYARAGQAPAALDPVTLELSLLFHPEGRKLARGWPNAEAAAQWSDCESYVAGCPCAALVRDCRAWATAVAHSPREVFAVAYALALRQLRYPDNDRATAEAVVRAAVGAFRGS